jgi:hypothetical protein
LSIGIDSWILDLSVDLGSMSWSICCQKLKAM